MLTDNTMAIPPAAPVFALSLAHVDANQLINYATSQGNKIHKQAVHSWQETKYNLEESGLATLLQVMHDQMVLGRPFSTFLKHSIMLPN